MIDFDFFVHLMRKKVSTEDTESELKDAFRVLDKNGQGWIGTTEMRAVCKVRSDIPCVGTWRLACAYVTQR